MAKRKAECEATASRLSGLCRSHSQKSPVRLPYSARGEGVYVQYPHRLR